MNTTFAIEEYKSLRHEAVERIMMQARLEIFSLTAAATVWTAGILLSDCTFWPCIAIIAAGIILASAVLASYESCAIFRIGIYLAARYDSDPTLGLAWEKSVFVGEDVTGPKRSWGNRHVLYYSVLVCGNFALAIAVSLHTTGWADRLGILIVEWTILAVISLAMVHPLKKIACAYKHKADGIRTWTERLQNAEPPPAGDSQ